MKRAKAETRRKKAKRISPARKGARQAVDLAVIRQQITNLVGNQAIGMVETTIGEADKGHYAAMKYLFEMIGLYPTTAQEERPGEESLARTLLRRLGLPEEPMLQAEVTKELQAQPGAETADTVK